MYVGSKACVRVGNEVSEWFPVRVRLRQGCVMSPWLFNLYIDGVVREVNARVVGRGLKLVDGNDNEWELNQLLFADDTGVVADSERKLCQLVTEFGRVCEGTKLRVNVGGMVREVNARVLGRGLKLVDGNDNEWELNQLLVADDTVVVADSERKMCQLVTEFGRVCERMKLRVNVGKSKVMRRTRNEDGARLNVMLNGEVLEEVDQFKYLAQL